MSGLEWRGGLDDAEIEQVRALVAAAADADGVAPVSEHVLLPLGGADTVHLLARDAEGGLTAFAQVDVEQRSGAGAELAVHPGHRRAGLGTAVVQALVERVAGGPLRIWAHGAHPAAASIAGDLGFAQVRALWRMGRSLLDPPIAHPELPDGVWLRPFVVGRDESAFLRVNKAAFSWHPEQGGWGADEVKLRESESWFDAQGFLLAVDAEDRVLGFHWTKIHEASGSHEPIGEVYVLGVDPSARGMRLGSMLTAAGLLHLRERGMRKVMLYVESDNDVAIRVYRDLGFTHWDSDVLYVR